MKSEKAQYLPQKEPNLRMIAASHNSGNGVGNFHFADQRKGRVIQENLVQKMNVEKPKPPIQHSTLLGNIVQRATFTKIESGTLDGKAAHKYQFIDGKNVHVDRNDGKMVLLHDLSNLIAKKDSGNMGPHVALSFHAGIIRVAINRGKSGGSVTSENLTKYTKQVMTAVSGNYAGKIDKVSKWFNSYYNNGNPNIIAVGGDYVSDEHTRHAEQFVAEHIIEAEKKKDQLEDGKYYGKGDVVKTAPEGASKVVRIGGQLEDCFWCHFDHFGMPIESGETTNSGNPRYEMFEGAKEFPFKETKGSNDHKLRKRGKGIMSMGTHGRGAAGVLARTRRVRDFSRILKQSPRGMTLASRRRKRADFLKRIQKLKAKKINK